MVTRTTSVCAPAGRAPRQPAGPPLKRALKTATFAAGCVLRPAYQLGGPQRLDRARTLLPVKRVLLTGMSGTGKSSVVRELAARGFKAVDTDDGWSEPLPDGRQRWREDAIQALPATEDADVLFVAGCEENRRNSMRSSTRSFC